MTDRLEQNRIAQLYADNKAAFQAAQESAGKGEFQVFEKTPKQQIEPVTQAFQQRVEPWFRECFPSAVCNDRLERGDRLLEEVLELLQSGDYPPERVAALVDYTWGRPNGEPSQEVGGVMVTLAAYCIAHGLDMHGAGETELARISQPEIVEKIRAKQAAKPTGSVLPIRTTPAPITTEQSSEIADRLAVFASEQAEVAFSTAPLDSIARHSFDLHMDLAKFVFNNLPTILTALRQPPSNATRKRISELEAENARLSKAVCSGILPELLNADETDALVDFVKHLRETAALTQGKPDA